MHIDWWTLGLQTVNALVLIWLLARFLFRPVADMVAERQRAAAALMADATAAKTAALSEQGHAAAEVDRLAQQRAQLLEAAAAEAATLKASLESAAHVDADRLRTAAQAEIDAMRRTAAQADADRASRFALEVTARLLDRLPQEARVSGFIDGLANELAKLPDATRAQVGADGSALRLIAPRVLQPDELTACRLALARALGREAPVEVTVDATVLAGLELEAPHAIVRNSFRNDLTQLKTELLAHDTTHA
ncbi:ATP synthase delta (OSCP) subunit [Paraburkholderia fungorum]|jgi:F-type H+-transporting ATPase subunit b|uniref:ATP synthase subunit b n=1 Tax=Paraburkholderia fungorum TaxID=134537 RepID=A0AAP5V0U8_9BURK|nr:ATP synthase F0 subunit B [Paraburkholderia fungorum]AJZ56764.1 ATP synthase delta (OSCP) subunit [Paraburkholderia fungorum]MDT8843282.1 F0F1 ATP synthase subunit B [Paraburkholderia fungorum]